MADCNGELFEFNVFAATLGWSRRHEFIYSRTRTTDDLIRCMYLTVLRLGGAPAEWVTDNMSALVVVQGAGGSGWSGRSSSPATRGSRSSCVIWQHFFGQGYERIRPASLNPAGVM